LCGAGGKVLQAVQDAKHHTTKVYGFGLSEKGSGNVMQDAKHHTTKSMTA
jgi:hypothetical protein